MTLEASASICDRCDIRCEILRAANVTFDLDSYSFGDDSSGLRTGKDLWTKTVISTGMLLGPFAQYGSRYTTNIGS